MAERPADGSLSIRACTPSDMPAVAALFNRTFRHSEAGAPPALEAYLRDLFLSPPFADPDIASRVYVGPNGTIDGFIGVLPMPMSLNGRPVRAALAGSLMVRDAAADPLAGARLFRAFLSGPQLLSFSETSNAVSQRMWEKSGGLTLAAYSMEWVRVLEPVGFAVATAADRFPAARLLRPFASAADRLLGAVGRNPLAGRRLEPMETAADHDAFVAALIELSAGYALRPEWDAASLSRILAHAQTKRRHGATIHRIVRDRTGRVAGCYLYYGRNGGIAYVLQMLAHPRAAEMVIDDLLAHARGRGFVALRGRADPKFQNALLRSKALFLHRSSLTVHSKDPQVIEALRLGDALVTGLAGEGWTRLIGDCFE